MVRTLLALFLLFASPLWGADLPIPAAGTPAPVQKAWTASPTPIPEPWRAIHRSLGGEADLQVGVLRLSFPRYDLNVLIEGVALAPGMVQSLLYFRAGPKGNQVLGNLVLMEREVVKTAENLTALGFEVLGIEGHYLNASPSLRSLHFVGRGTDGKLTANLKKALGTTGVLASPSALSPGGVLLAAISPSLSSVEESFGSIRREGGALGFRLHRGGLGNPSEEDFPHECTFLFQGSGTTLAVGGEWTLDPEELAQVLRVFQKQGIRVCSISRTRSLEGKGTCRVRYWYAGDPGTVIPTLRKFREKWTAPGNGESQAPGAPAFSTPDPIGGP